MKKTVITAAAMLVSTAAIAQVPFSSVDADGDNRLSFEEVTAVYANVSSNDFQEIDTDGDSLIDPTEARAPVAVEIMGEQSATTTGMTVDIDTEGNQTMYYDYDEASARYPELSAEDFEEIDENGDGLLDAVELRQPAAVAVLTQG
ncbi:EF hand [Tranquillimonas rosea]|uniref:EF hand n=1 Tax=Tranquillimonas rosea TaxID=641238 RepID=A0A1H9WTN4_9RHOB|nr:EF-hand domain-containing protein [Tranquillimonas rosea]SES37286.1 EF hand [Tranquillimonas rosea]